MREIKFRAWDTNTNAMYSMKQLLLRWNTLSILTCPYFKIMQYTGLKDKNGTEIYEGDIVEYEIIGEVDSHYIGNVKFDKSSWRVFWNDKDRIRKDLEFWATEREIEVIGNIYENPELLEGRE